MPQIFSKTKDDLSQLSSLMSDTVQNFEHWVRNCYNKEEICDHVFSGTWLLRTHEFPSTKTEK